MILFKDDYNNFPTAIIDTKTTNQSFLKMAELYRRMGVKNNAFHLTLMQPELQGVDPYDPNLDTATKLKIKEECLYNPWYIFREVMRVPAQSGNAPVRFRVNRGNIALIWAFFCGIDFCLIQPRQTGKSVSTDCLMVALLFIVCANTKVNMITKDNKLRTANVDRLKKIRSLLPTYLWVESKEDSDNSLEVTHFAKENVYSTAVAQNSESSALNVGRGLTAAIAHLDEVPFIKFIGTVIPAMLAAGTAAREEARNAGQPCGTVYTTTAGKIDDRDGGYFYNLLMEGVVWSEHFFDSFNVVELTKYLTKASRSEDGSVIINGTFSHKQLGYSDEWLLRALRDAKSRGQDADRDFFNRWTRGSLRSPLSQKLNDRIAESEMEVSHLEMTEDFYSIRWYVDESDINEYMKNNDVILGLDTSEGVGRDSIALVGLNSQDAGTVFAMDVNETNLIMFSKFLAMLLITYERTTLVIERKSTGLMIVDALIISLLGEGVDPFKRIYNTIIQNQDERPTDYAEISRGVTDRNSSTYTAHKKSFGFNTNGNTREFLYSRVLQNAAKTSGNLVRDKTLGTEIRGLVVKNNRIDHNTSGHDDLVIAWLLANWFLMYGRDHAHYGLDSRRVLAMASASGNAVDADELQRRSNQAKLKESIEDIQNRLTEANDSFKIAVLEHKLRSLTRRLNMVGSETLSIDALLKEASEKRSIQRAEIAAQRTNAPTSHKDIVPTWWTKRRGRR